MIERKEFGADDYEYQHVRAQIATFEAERLAKEGFKFFSQETYRNAAYLEEKAFNLAPNMSAGDKGDIESLMKKVKDVFAGKGGLGDFNFDGAIVMEVSDLDSSPFGTRKRGGVGMFGHTYDELFANARRANRGFGSDTRREGAAPAGSRG